MAVVSKLNIVIASTLTGTEGLASQSAKIALDVKNSLTAVETDAIFSVTGTISGGSDDHDLLGSLVDALGDGVTFAKVMYVFVRNNGSNAMTLGGTNNIPLFGNTSDLLNIAANAYVSYTDETGITVTAGTGDLITISGTDGDDYDLIVIGSSS